jgi:3-hydroxyisobutyrate dehydrogenase-like beta-hydroxyacid dehydrogenase
MNEATVIGLGKMGVTLARLLLRAGYRVTVWNRTPEKAAALVREGARLAPSAADAVQACPILVLCVHDYTAAREILEASPVAAALPRRTVVNLSTGSPKDARALEQWIHARGGRYLDGAIQAAPAQMGQPDTMILLSGEPAAFAAAEPALKVFAGNLNYLGEQIGAASAMDLATLSYVYGASIGFFHGARIAEVEGFRVDDYGAIVAKIAPAFGEFLKYEGSVIQSGDFTATESPLSISVEATARLAETARESGINDDLPSFVASFFRRAVAAGYQSEEAAAIIKVLRAHEGVQLSLHSPSSNSARAFSS